MLSNSSDNEEISVLPVVIFKYNRLKKEFISDNYKENLTHGAFNKNEVEQTLRQIAGSINQYTFGEYWRKWLASYLILVFICILAIIIVAVIEGPKSFPGLFGACFGIIIVATILISFYAMKHNFGRAAYSVMIRKRVLKLLIGVNLYYQTKGYQWFVPPSFPNTIELWKAKFADRPEREGNQTERTDITDHRIQVENEHIQSRGREVPLGTVRNIILKPK